MKRRQLRFVSYSAAARKRLDDLGADALPSMRIAKKKEHAVVAGAAGALRDAHVEGPSQPTG